MTVKELRTEEEQLSRLLELKKKEIEKLEFSERDAQEKVRVQNELLDCKESELRVFTRKLKKMKDELKIVSINRENIIKGTDELKRNATKMMQDARKEMNVAENMMALVKEDKQKVHAQQKEIEGKKEKMRNFIKTL